MNSNTFRKYFQFLKNLTVFRWLFGPFDRKAYWTHWISVIWLLLISETETENHAWPKHATAPAPGDWLGFSRLKCHGIARFRRWKTGMPVNDQTTSRWGSQQILRGPGLMLVFSLCVTLVVVEKHAKLSMSRILLLSHPHPPNIQRMHVAYNSAPFIMLHYRLAKQSPKIINKLNKCDVHCGCGIHIFCQSFRSFLACKRITLSFCGKGDPGMYVSCL